MTFVQFCSCNQCDFVVQRVHNITGLMVSTEAHKTGGYSPSAV